MGRGPGWLTDVGGAGEGRKEGAPTPWLLRKDWNERGEMRGGEWTILYPIFNGEGGGWPN